MDVNGIGSFLNTITDAKAAQAKSDQIKFEELLEQAMKDDGNDALKEAAEEFEAYFLNKVFSEMRQSIPKSDLVESSQGKEYYEDMLYEAYSKAISKGTGAGLKDMLYKQLKK